MTNVVIFCGGRGSATMISALTGVKEVSLTAVVNAYDSGLSTGRVRHAVPGLLGPSDVRKNISTLALAQGDAVSVRCAELMEYRLPESEFESETQFNALARNDLARLPEQLNHIVRDLPPSVWASVNESLQVFIQHLQRSPFSFQDLAVGNAALAGFFLKTGDFGAAITRYSGLFDLGGHRVLNVTRGEDLWLSARAGQQFCPDEGVLVAQPPAVPIDDLFLLPRAEQEAIYDNAASWIDAAGIGSRVHDAESLPMLGAGAAAAIGNADVIVYGPGTQHSSLLPSYLTIGVAEAIAANSAAAKLLFLNAGADKDQHPAETGADYVRKLRFFLTRRYVLDLPLQVLVTEVIGDPESAQSLTSLDPGVILTTGAWTSAAGKHSGEAVTRKILSAARSVSRAQETSHVA
jgi:2-phospho-L-lactate transferase/gluconeogenesis factor (CofD/UPF0052 family)